MNETKTESLGIYIVVGVSGILVAVALVIDSLTYDQKMQVIQWWSVFAGSLLGVNVIGRTALKASGKYNDINRSPALIRLANYEADNKIDEALYNEKLKKMYVELDMMKTNIAKMTATIKPPQDPI